MEEKTEGLLLHAIPYLGSQKILKIFTPDHGLISLIVKKTTLTAFTSPFLIAEWVYKKGKEEIHLLNDATMLNDLSSLRDTYPILSSAGTLAQDLLRSQFPGKKGTGLYALTLAYLQKLPLFPHPETLIASFRLKLLLHEGLLALQKGCAECSAPALHLSEGESLCPTHASLRGISFHPEEWEKLQILTYTRKFAPLEPLSIDGTLQKKIENLLSERTKN